MKPISEANVYGISLCCIIVYLCL